MGQLTNTVIKIAKLLGLSRSKIDGLVTGGAIPAIAMPLRPIVERHRVLDTPATNQFADDESIDPVLAGLGAAFARATLGVRFAECWQPDASARSKLSLTLATVRPA
jgi:hypothetical protein